MLPLRALATTTAVLLLASCGTGDAEPEASASASPETSESSPTDSPSSPSPSMTDSGTATPSAEPSASPRVRPKRTEVYFLVDTRAGLRLARETRALPGLDVGAEAVKAMIAGPEDPDYASSWNPRTKVRSVTTDGGVVEVDLSPAARRADIGSEGAERMVQQLVYTVTSAVDPRAKVRLLIDGKPAGDLWGTVVWNRPISRANPDDVRMFVQIDSPRDGSVTDSPLTVTGEANAFEATVPWRVLDGTGGVVKRGFTTAQEGMTFSPYSFKVKLPPGSYLLEVSEDDPSGGEGGTPMVDTKRITIR